MILATDTDTGSRKVERELERGRKLVLERISLKCTKRSRPPYIRPIG
jgi:hypothetical protein